jgi:protein-tyrosine phosphatase
VSWQLDLAVKIRPHLIFYCTNKEYCTVEQAKQMVNFIDDAHSDPRNVLLLVNCKFGMCRSGAVVDYAGQVCHLSFWEQKNRNPQIVPNYWVRNLMFEEFYTRNLHC